MFMVSEIGKQRKWIFLESIRPEFLALNPLVGIRYNEGFLIASDENHHAIVPMENSGMLIAGIGKDHDVEQVILNPPLQAAIFRINKMLPIVSREINYKFVKDVVESVTQMLSKIIYLAEPFVAEVTIFNLHALNAGSKEPPIICCYSDGSHCIHNLALATGGGNYCADHPLGALRRLQPGGGVKEKGRVLFEVNTEEEGSRKHGIILDLLSLTTGTRKAYKSYSFYEDEEREVTEQSLEISGSITGNESREEVTRIIREIFEKRGLSKKPYVLGNFSKNGYTEEPLF